MFALNSAGVSPNFCNKLEIVLIVLITPKELIWLMISNHRA